MRKYTWNNRFDICEISSQELFCHNGLKRERFVLQAPPCIDLNDKYPLVIGLHGYSDSKKTFFTPIIVDNKEQQEQFPCFYFAPNNSNKGWENNTQWIRDLINEMIESYPIDKNRVYIIGFSWGGSGSFPFAESLYRECGIIPAGIVRCAGMSRTTLASPLNEKTAVWYNVGTADTERVLDVAVEYYHINRDVKRNEVVEEDNIGGFHRETRIIAEKRKISYYTGMGHEYTPVFINLSVLDWLFDQSL